MIPWFTLTPRAPMPRVVPCVVLIALASATGCVSDDPMNTTGGSARLSQAANNSSQYTGAWDLQTTNMDERWSEDPTVMEPDYPYAGLQPGFGSSAFTQYGS
ncbi:MAG: hypothetical protein FJ256_08530 [Phycisphaerae bacterium]|nr:hypothetical protein [Phycisphaerae bacterium]